MLHCCDLTTGNSTAPTSCSQLSPATSGLILTNVGNSSFGQAHSNSRLNINESHRPQAQSELGISNICSDYDKFDT